MRRPPSVRRWRRFRARAAAAACHHSSRPGCRDSPRRPTMPTRRHGTATRSHCAAACAGSKCSYRRCGPCSWPCRAPSRRARCPACVSGRPPPRRQVAGGDPSAQPLWQRWPGGATPRNPPHAASGTPRQPLCRWVQNGCRIARRPLTGRRETTPILLRGGLVADGIGTTTRRADVAIDGQAITSIGLTDATPPGCEVIDLAPGSVSCPGFIDAHAHGEGPLLATGRVDGALAQGVTTLVVGQDGQSWIGAAAGTARYLNRYFAAVNGALEPARDLSVAAYRDAIAGKLTQNVAVLASQGTIRHNIVGMASRPLDQDERAAARRQVENALADGAVGLSSGFDYLPSRFGDIGELADMARPL